MKKAAIYARFSSDRQNEKSCKDQIDLCSSWAERNGFTVVEVFQDMAISGASTVNRAGLTNLMHAAQLNLFDVVIAEALDRLSRDQADLSNMRKKLAFNNISIHTVQDGEVSTMHVGIKGLMGELFLADLAQKTRRGMQAVVKEGRQAGGKSYGYDLTPGKAGKLVINETEASIVRRIFHEYIAGSTPRQIATRLNNDNIPSPRGGKWNASTINGSKSRQNGVLQNRLYIGQIVWNRQKFIKNPATGKRVSRLNPESEWVINDAPELRILEDETYQQAAAIKTEKSRHSIQQAHRATHVLSGLVKCGNCGASYTILNRGRLGCAGHRERGDCSNNRSVTRRHIEERVFTALQNQLSQPAMLEEYVKTYSEERKKLEKQGNAQLDSKQKRLEELNSGINRIIDFIVQGNNSDSLSGKLKELESEKEVLTTELQIAALNRKPIEFKPEQATIYRKLITELQSHLDSMQDSVEKDSIFSEVRKLIDKIIVIPTGERQPVNLVVHGELANLLSVSENTIPYGCRGKVVAGGGFEPPTFGL